MADTKEENRDRFYNFYTGCSRVWALSDHWQTETGFGNLISYYENKHTYGAVTPGATPDDLDGVIFNLHSTFYTAKPYVSFIYKKPESWGKWRFQSKYEYSYGMEISGSSDSTSEVNPQYWQRSNTIKFYPEIYTSELHAESI
ncbi:MAG TPA: hypothetical protein EYH12_06430 [Psychromonas hadalis]|nr:hypothetical protein [Psychromonas hadalis]